MENNNKPNHKKVKNQETNTVVPQNQNHNAKKVALGPNTKR
ncbi:MAG: hypothetical protein ACOX2Q_05960 [Dehalobacterium sp.]